MRRRRAVSLAEVLIASCILAMGLVPILGSLHTSNRDAVFLEFHTQALARARSLLEAARVWGPPAFDRLLAGKAEVQVPLAPAAGGPTVAPAQTLLEVRMGRVEERVTVTALTRRGGAGLFLLRARVAWQHPGELRQHEVVLVTLVGDPRASQIDPTGLP